MTALFEYVTALLENLGLVLFSFINKQKKE